MLFFIRLFSLLPLALLYGIADYIIYPLVRYVLRYRLKLVRKNIRLSFPEKSAQEQHTIINAFYHHFASMLVEVIYGYRVSDEEMRQRVVFNNIQLIERLAYEHKGVFLMLGHMGNWEWIADVAKRYSDKSIREYNVFRRQKNASADRAISLLRAKRGGGEIEKSQLLRQMVRFARETTPVTISLLADQKPSPNNAHFWTTFLSQDTAFLNGGEVLARKFDYGLIYAYITSPRRGYYNVDVQPISENAVDSQPNEITAKYAQLLEQNIRQQPELWLWTHNRWKWSRPETENTNG